jgi:hypothetical protein
MKNPFILLFGICIIFTFGACNNDDESLVVEDTPVTIGQFRVNLSDLSPNGGTLTHNLNNPFRIDFDLEDEGLMRDFEFYLLVNNETDKRYTMTYEIDLMTTEISFGYTFGSLNRFQFDNGEIYDTQSGDELYFYATVKDNTDNLTSINFVVTLTE